MKLTQAQKLRKVRLYLNLTQKELGRRIGLSTSTIFSYDNKRRTVSPRVCKWVNKTYRKHQLSKKVIKSARENTLCTFMPLGILKIQKEQIMKKYDLCVKS